MNGVKIYLVGGAVRDLILGTPNMDRDYVVVGATPEHMLQEGFTPIEAAEFPIFIKDGEEYALARKEKKTSKGYHGFEVMFSPDITLEEDLMRRDLTINSIAYDKEVADKGFNGFIDPYNGMEDLADKVLRHTSIAFKEDPLRVLRVARFMAQLGDWEFTVAEETMNLMQDMVTAGEINDLTPERVWKETQKALGTSHPERYFETLLECGALEVLMPELFNLVNVPQRLEHHPENCCFIHTMLALKQAVKLGNRSPIVNFATLLHDLGKGITPIAELPMHRSHEITGVPLVEAFCDRLKVPTSYRNAAKRVTRYHLCSHRITEMRAVKVIDMFDDLAVLRVGQDELNVTGLDIFLKACEADARGRLGKEDRPYPQAVYIRAMHQAVIGTDRAPYIERYKGAEIGKHIRQAQIRNANRVRWMFGHLKKRDLNPGLYPYIAVTEDTVDFPLWNLIGQMVGYLRYKPNGSKAHGIPDEERKYKPHLPSRTVTAWGLERLNPDNRLVFLVEGVFKASRFHNRGLNALATLCNDPKHLAEWLKNLGYTIISVCDGDKAGEKLGQYGFSYQLPDGQYVDEMSDEEFDNLVAQLLTFTKVN